MLISSRFLLTLAGSALLLSACATTPQQRAARVEKDVEEMVQVYGPGCEKLGYTADTDQWRDCVIRLNQRDHLLYLNRPTTTSCIGHRGFYNCTSF